MGSSNKTVRIDDEFLSIVTEYVSLMKGVYGTAPSVNSILNSSMIFGFDRILMPLRLISNGQFKADDKFTENFNTKYKVRCNELLERFLEYQLYLESVESEA